MTLDLLDISSPSFPSALNFLLPSFIPSSSPSFLTFIPSLPSSFPYSLFLPSFFPPVLSANLITVSAKSLLEINASLKERYSKGSAEAFLNTWGESCPFWKGGKEHSKWEQFPREKLTLEMCLVSISPSSEVMWSWAFLLYATPVPVDMFWWSSMRSICWPVTLRFI